MKHFTILLLLASAFIQKTEQPVTVLEATHQRWYNEPGRKSDTGETYQIEVFINTPQPLEFTNLWIGHKNVPFFTKFWHTDIQKKIANGDKLYIVFSKTKGEPEGDFIQRRLPVQYKGAALIEYALAGKAQYLVVKSFKKLPDINGL